MRCLFACLVWGFCLFILLFLSLFFFSQSVVREVARWRANRDGKMSGTGVHDVKLTENQ